MHRRHAFRVPRAWNDARRRDFRRSGRRHVDILDARVEEDDASMSVRIRCDQGVYTVQFAKTGPLTSQLRLHPAAGDADVATTHALTDLVLP